MTDVAPGSPKIHSGLAAREFSSTTPAPDRDVSVIEMLSVLLRRWRLVAGLPLLVAVITGIVSLVTRATYTATATFVPEVRTQSRLPGTVTTLAGQLGLPLGTDPSQSPRFYAQVAHSRELLERLLLTRFPGKPAEAPVSDSTTLLRLIQVKGRDHADSLARGVRELDDLIAVRVDLQTNIIRLSADARSPDLAAAVANRLVEYLNDFNTKTRQSQARERRKFVEQRVVAAAQELGGAEEAVKTFYERNHGWQQAPELVFEEARLRRQVTISQEVYLTLKREYETARIEEVNDTPVFTVIEAAIPPQERSRPRRTLQVLLALVVGTLISVPWAFAAQHFERARHDGDADYREFSALLERVRGDLSRVVLPFRRRP